MSRRWLVQVVSRDETRQYLLAAEGWREAVGAAQQLRGEQGQPLVHSSSVPDVGQAVSPDGRVRYRVMIAPLSLGATVDSRPPSNFPTPTSEATVKENAPTAVQSRGPEMSLLYERADEPAPDRPIAYRERGFSVPPGLQRQALGQALASELERVRTELGDARSMKYVRLAAFDHHFEDKPRRAPVATIVWRDWKGKPQLEVEGSPMDLESALESSSAPPPSAAEPVREVTPVSLTIDVGGSPSSTEPPAARRSPLEDVPVASVQPPTPEELEELKRRFPSTPAPSGTKRNAIYHSRPPSSASHASSSAPSSAGVRPGRSPGDEGGGPRSSGRRAESGEDLVSAVFECIHELHFAKDLAEGAQVVLDVIGEFLPCEGALVYVFDAGKREYCVVRARGASSRDVLMERVSEADDLFKRVARGRGTFRSDTARAYPHFRKPRYEALVSEPRAAMVGAVRQAGRDLGMIELLNPSGGGPFQSSEESALEYVCSQFAEFLAERPIVLTEDVLLRGLSSSQGR